MLHVIKIAALIKATNLVMDSEFVILNDGMDPAAPTDTIANIRFLNTVEVLREGFENEKYAIKLVPVKFGTSDLLYQPDDTKQRWYAAKAKPLDEILKKFSKKLGIEVRDPSELSEFQKFLMKEEVK